MLQVCYLCLENSGKESKASHGACMQCNKTGCKDSFHVTCAQAHGLLCEEAGNYMDNVKYCGYCDHHFSRINKKLVKTIPAFRPVPNDDLSPVPRSAAQTLQEALIMAEIKFKQNGTLLFILLTHFKPSLLQPRQRFPGAEGGSEAPSGGQFGKRQRKERAETRLHDL